MGERMDIVQIIETLGIPVAVAFVLGYGCLYLMKFITGKLMERNHFRQTGKIKIGGEISEMKFSELTKCLVRVTEKVIFGF